MNSGVLVLMYHALENGELPAGAKDVGEQCYVLQVKQFKEQMEYLHEEGFKTFLFEELIVQKEWPEKSVVITFDDGHESNIILALPILRQYGFKAEFFITTDWIGTPHYLTGEQIQLLRNAGMGIGSHGVSHKFFDGMNNSEAERELRQSKDTLTQIIGQKVSSFSAPGGRMRRRTAAIAQYVGFQVVCTSRPGVMVRDQATLSIPRLTLKSDTDIEVFKCMVAKERGYLVEQIIRYILLSVLKRVMGRKGYENMRKFLLREK